ncbi:hypothetical protein [Streptomyces thioluteus]
MRTPSSGLPEPHGLTQPLQHPSRRRSAAAVEQLARIPLRRRADTLS